MAAANSLYVGDLAPEVSEADLHSTFSALAHVASVRVCRDATTRASLRYGYVNFNRPEDAELVLQQLPAPVICNRTCRVMRNQRDLVNRKNAANNLHVRDLAPTVTSSILREHFAPFGKIASCKVSGDATGKPFGYGFVLFEREEDANEALAKLDKSVLENKQIAVEKYKPRDERDTGARFTNVYVRPSFSKEKLENLFSQYGTITSSFIGKTSACINFQEHEQAVEAVAKLNGYDFEGVKLYVVKALSKEERLKLKHKITGKANLYVKNLADEIDDQKLTEEFSKYGTIVSAVVQRDAQGNSRGFGYVCFSNPDEARECIKSMNGRMVYSKPLYVGFHQSKSARQQENQQRFGQITPPQAPGQIYPPMYHPYAYVHPFFRPGPPPPFPPFPPAVLARRPPVAPPQQPQQPQAAVQRRPDPEKQSIGEQLYPNIARINKDKAGKITGMLLEMDIEDIRPLLTDRESLKEKVKEALQVLKDAGQ